MFNFLSWQLKLFALEDFCDVEIEEIAVENRLNNSGDDSDDVVEP